MGSRGLEPAVRRRRRAFISATGARLGAARCARWRRAPRRDRAGRRHVRDRARGRRRTGARGRRDARGPRLYRRYDHPRPGGKGTSRRREAHVSKVDEAVVALRAGKPVVLPFDTVYGLAADPYRDASARRLYRLKGRPETQPSARVARDLAYLLECIPELRG